MSGTRRDGSGPARGRRAADGGGRHDLVVKVWDKSVRGKMGMLAAGSDRAIVPALPQYDRSR